MFKDEKSLFCLLILTGNPVFRYQKPNGIACEQHKDFDGKNMEEAPFYLPVNA
jgi:hypothetical protein